MTQDLTGLFRGAGASYDAGMPLVWELTSKLKAWLSNEKLKILNEGWLKQGSGHPEEVIDDVISVLQRDDLHYESILGYLEVQARRERKFSKHYYSLYSWLVEIIYFKLYFKHVHEASFVLDHLDLYRGITKLYRENCPLWVFSLNHDSIVEMIAKKFPIPLHSGFSSDTIKLPRRNSEGKIIGFVEAEILDKETLDKGFGEQWNQNPTLTRQSAKLGLKPASKWQNTSDVL